MLVSLHDPFAIRTDSGLYACLLASKCVLSYVSVIQSCHISKDLTEMH